MSEREGFAAGVPCWVDTFRADPEATARFYAGLFGWEATRRTPADVEARYLVATLRGRDVAGIGSLPAPDVAPDWVTWVQVDDVGEALAAAVAAGGTVAVPAGRSYDEGRIAMFVDPAGATLGVREPGTDLRGAQVVNEPAAWAMSLLATPDVEAAARFYGAVFGWQTETFGEGEGAPTMFRLPGFFGGEPSQPVPRDVVAVMAPAAPDQPPRWAVNFWVADADAAAATATELGGTVPSAPTDQGGFRNATIADPDGASIAVSQLLAQS